MHEEHLLDWTVEATGGHGSTVVPAPLPAAVPGCVHTDLIAAGLLTDITVAGDPDDQLWVSATPWRYRTTVRRPARPFERAVLEFAGIDTYATISVNGRRRLTTGNMFRTFELDVTADLASAGQVEIVVDLVPALPIAMEREAANPLPRPEDYWRPFSQVRKMACSFGWDWGPATLTVGLWRPVRLLTWTGARLTDVRVRACAPAEVSVDVVVDGRASDVGVVVDDGGRAVATAVLPVVGGQAHGTVEVPDARRWWPCTEGAQPLYGVTVTLLAGDDVLDRRSLTVGFRSVSLVQEPDEPGSSCELHVNGRRVWIRGFDWIPDDTFPSRVTPERYRARLAEAVAAGANAVRVWGGGLFEADAFYDACDELGLLVLQDFLFACAAYPEDTGTVAEVRAEASDNVRRLRHRASLALWCGNNENLWGHEDWGWKEALAGRPWGQTYYREILPAIVADLDGTRPYVPGSPFSPDGHHPNDPGHGMSHIWDVWNERDYADYETWRPRFVSEFGYQAPASWGTLVEAVGGPIDPAGPVLTRHQRATDGDAKLAAGLDRHLPAPPADGVAWYFATQLLQARAVLTGVGHLRSLHDHCSGAIWWQLNDCWPSVSWSVIDVRGRRKLAWHAVREAFGARLVKVVAGPGVALVNDTSAVWSERVTVQTLTGDAVSLLVERDVEVPPHGCVVLDVDPAVGAEADAVIADAGGRRSVRWLVPDPKLELRPQDADVEARSTGPQDVLLTVTARVVLRDLSLLAELADPDAVVEGQLVTLLPGESATFHVTFPDGVPGLSSSVWRQLLWSDNRLRHQDGGKADELSPR